jgi:hypothetical protein
MRKLNEEKAIQAIKNKNNISVAAILREIGLSDKNGTNYQKIYSIVKKHGLDTAHWLGQAFNKGVALGNKRPLSDYLSNKFSINSFNLKKRLIDEKIKEHRCENCKNDSWLEKKIPLELHHRDGDNKNNCLENLELLCPNCHALTPNFCGKNVKASKRSVKRQKVTEEEIIQTIKQSYNILGVLKTLNLNNYGKNYDRINTILEKHNLIFLEKPIKNEIEPNKNWRSDPKPSMRKVERPSKEELIDLVKTKSMLEITRMFGLKSDNSIRKWCDNYNIDYKSLSPFSFKSK